MPEDQNLSKERIYEEQRLGKSMLEANSEKAKSRYNNQTIFNGINNQTFVRYEISVYLDLFVQFEREVQVIDVYC